MRRYRWRLCGLLAAALVLMLGAGASPTLADEQREIEELRHEVQELRRRDRERERELAELRRALETLGARPQRAAGAPAEAAATPRDAAGASPPTGAPDAARAALPAAPPPATALDRAVAALDAERDTTTAPGRPGEPVFVRRFGAAQVSLLDISMDVLWAAGGSSAPEPEIRDLQAGFHDPRRRGFTLQQAEVGLAGAVDPYFRADVFVIATPDEVELEEAFATSTSLPWGLQLEAGTFFTEFGIINPRHPHQWDWLDQPVIASRLFGGEGLRGPGARLAWLTPLPWFSEVHAGAQNPNEGERTASFIGEDEVGGRPRVKQDVDGLADLLYLARWVNSWDLGPSVTTKIGVSGLFGPNATGGDGRTYVYGTDMLWKWQPPDNFRGWPFVAWQTELMKRDFVADDFVAGTAIEEDEGDEDDHGHARVARFRDRQEEGEDEEDLARAILRDWGLYTQLLWGVRHPWALGIRYEYASASGTSLPDGRNQDALRDDRHRLSPLVVWQPTEFTRFRLQYNFDRARFLRGDDAHSVWFGMEVLYGAHAAHEY